MKLRGDRDALRYLTHLGHWSPDVVVDGRGAVYAAWHVQGVNATLDAARAVMGRWLADNKLLHGVGDPRLELWDHYTCTLGHPMRRLPEPGSWFGRLADDAYREMPGNASLSRRDLWVTLVLNPSSGLGALLRAVVASPMRFARPDGWFVREFRDLAAAVGDGLARYGARRLGLRPGPRGVRFSEVFEAWHLIANNRFRPCPVTAGPMGRLIVPEAPAFGDRRSRELLIPGAEGARYAAGLTMLDYPEEVDPYATDELRGMECGMTLTSALLIRPKQREINRLTTVFTFGRSGEHPALAEAGLVDAMAKVVGAKAAIEAGRALPVVHHWTATLFAASLGELDHHVAKATRVLADNGIVALRQGVAIKDVFYSNVPGNLRRSPCAEKVKSVEALAFGARHNVPAGPERGRWGAPLLMLKTTRGTEYAYHAHAQGIEGADAEHSGSAQVYGGSGSGKTTLAAMLYGVGAQRVPGCRSVFLDSELGLSVFVEAMGGPYMEFRPGRPAFGLLSSLADTPEDAAHAKQLLRSLVLQDGKGPIPSLDDERLARGVARQLALPPALRSVAGVSAFLPNRPRTDGQDRTQDRLRPWCRGERLGWVFDNPADPLDLSARVMGFDTTELRKDPEVCGPAMAHLLYRVSKLVDGAPLVLAIDEAQQIRLIPELDRAVQHYLATIRKREGVVVLLTQMVETLHSGGAASAAFRTLVPTSIYFADAEADHDTLVRGGRLTEAEYEVLTEQLPNMRRSFLLKRPGVSMVCTFDLSGAMEVVSVLSARERTYGFMRHVQAARGAAPEQWVPLFMQEAPRIAREPLSKPRPVARLEAAE